MELSHRIINEACIVDVEGQFIGHQSRELDTYIKTILLQGTELKILILNLSKAFQIDSVGIGIMLKSYKVLQEKQIQFALCQLHDEMIDFLKFIRIDSMIPIYDTEEDVIKRLKEEAS